MKRTPLLCGLVSFLMAFAGTIAALLLASPVIVNAQEVRMTAAGLTIVRPDGLAGITADVRPMGGGLLQILGVDGQTLRIQLGAGGTAACSPGDTSSYCQEGANAGIDVRHPNGDLAVRLGLLAPTLIPGVRLVDEQGNIRYQASLDHDGTPSIQLLDADGKVLWSAP